MNTIVYMGEPRGGGEGLKENKEKKFKKHLEV